jgi:Phosphoglucose isomerase
MGVELGKVLAKNILSQLDKPEDVKGHDSSVSDIKKYLDQNANENVDCWFDSLLSKVQKGVNLTSVYNVQ